MWKEFEGGWEERELGGVSKCRKRARLGARWQNSGAGKHQQPLCHVQPKPPWQPRAHRHTHLQAMMTCQSPALARAAAALRPRPLEAPVMITVGFWVAGLLLVEPGVVAATRSAVAARTTTQRGAACVGQGTKWRC